MNYGHIRICFFCFLLSSANIYAQFESVFGDENTEWNYIATTCDQALVNSYLVEKDTLISGVTYKKFAESGFIRQSPEHDKLWFRSEAEEEDFLIFDLTMSVGDTFMIDTLAVVVDSTYIEEDRQIIRFDYSPPHCGIIDTLKFIEGIGPNYDFKFLMIGLLYDAKLLRCYTRDSITANYLSFYFSGECADDITSTENVSLIHTQIYPNPFSEVLNLEFDDFKQRKIQIINSFGQLIFSGTSTQSRFSIDTSQLAKGIYFLSVYERDMMTTQQLVKLSGDNR